MISGISYGTYLIFGILTFGGAAFVWFFVPETKRLTLEEMDVIFGSEVSLPISHFLSYLLFPIASYHS